MALIKCKECGKEVSDKAKTCVHCGCPLKDESQNVPKKKKYSKIYIWLVIILPLLSCLLLWLVDYFLNSFLISLLIAVIFITVLEIVLILKDYKSLIKANVDVSSLGEISLYKINIPKYIIRRASLLKESSLKFIIWLTSFILFIVIIILEFNPLKYFDSSKYIKLVKEGNFYLCSDYKVEELINNYMKNPKWDYENKNGKKIVSVKGKITYLDKKSDGLIEFYIEDEEFKFYTFKIDNKEQSEIMFYAFLENLCENMSDNDNISNEKDNNEISEEDTILSFKDGKVISKDEYYKELKNSGNNALSTLVNMIDRYIYEKEFTSEIENAKNYAEVQIKSLRNNYNSDEEMEQALQSYGYGTIEAYKEYVYLSYLQNHAIETYVKGLITEEELKDYYENNVYPKISLAHILIVPKSSNDKEALEKAKKIIEELNTVKENNGNVAEKFAELVKKYSEDTTKDSGGYLEVDNNSLNPELIKAALKLEDGDYSKEPVKTEYGYHIILKIKTHEKVSYNDSLETMKEKIANKKIEEKPSLVYEAIKYYFTKYDVKIYDEELKKEYNKYMEQLKNAI